MQAQFELGSDEDDDVQGLIVETRMFVASRQEKLNTLQGCVQRVLQKGMKFEKVMACRRLSNHFLRRKDTP